MKLSVLGEGYEDDGTEVLKALTDNLLCAVVK